MSKPKVLIVGAGIAGTCLATLLKKKGISYLLLDKAAKAPEYSYTINLERRAYRPLLKAIDISEDAFKKDVAIGSGAGDALRVPRTKFETFLREDVSKGLGVQWNSKVESITVSSSGLTSVRTEDGSEHTADFTLAADGVHSAIRKLVLPAEDPTVLPYVAINGKRRIPVDEAEKLFKSLNEAGEQKIGNAAISYSTMSPKESGSDKVSLSYTYSRTPKQNDPLYRPDRPNAGAKDIPDDFFQELEALKPLPEPFNSILDANVVRNDRLLHWLLRVGLVPELDLKELWKRQSIVLMGDAAHALPVLGGNGANEAILDALAFAEILEGRRRPDELYDERSDAWLEAIKQSRKHLEAVHSPPSSL